MAANNHIDLVVKTMRVLEIIGAQGGGMPLGDIAARAGLVKSSAFRILFTLTELGYCEKVAGNGTYAATLKLRALGGTDARSSLVAIAKLRLEQSRDRLGESAWLAELRGGSVIVVAVAEAAHPLRLAFHVGDICPWHASALGKAVAAQLAPPQLLEVLGSGRLHQFTKSTITARRKLLSELTLIRHRGYSVNREETIDGALAYGAPVFDGSGAVVASVSITAPTARCSRSKSEAMIGEVKALGQAITQDVARHGLDARPGGGFVTSQAGDLTA